MVSLDGRTDGADAIVDQRLRLVDASVIGEPGASGSSWRRHYLIDLSTLRCEPAWVTSPDAGETLTRFAVQADDALMVERGLAHRRGIRQVIDHGGDVVVRMNLVNRWKMTKDRLLNRCPIGGNWRSVRSGADGLGYATNKASSRFGSAP